MASYSNTQNGGNGTASSRNRDRESLKPQMRSAIRALIQDFSPIWFTWCMNIGIIAIILHELPYQFDGLGVISSILYVIDLVLFIICSCIMIARIAIYRRQAVDEIGSNVQELAFLAAITIAWMTLTSLTALIASTAHWGRDSFTIVAYVMWWIAVFASVLTAITVFTVLTKKNLTQANDFNPAIIVPAVAVATAAAEGAIVANYAAGITARMAVPVIVVSFMLLGMGMFLSIVLYTLFLQRMLKNGFMESAKKPQLVLLVGPTGQCASALLGLGTAAVTHFGAYEKGPFLQTQAAMSLHAACVLLALMFFGFGIFWTIYFCYAILEGTFKRELSWSPAWYSTIFPLGTMCTAMIFFGQAMDSPAFRVLATALAVLLVINILINLVFTIVAIAKGKILIVREDPRTKKES